MARRTSIAATEAQAPLMRRFKQDGAAHRHAGNPGGAGICADRIDPPPETVCATAGHGQKGR